MDAGEKGEGANEHLQEHRAGTNLGHGNGSSPWPPVAHLWAGTDLCRLGMSDPSLDVQPNNAVLATRSPARLNATSQNSEFGSDRRRASAIDDSCHVDVSAKSR